MYYDKSKFEGYQKLVKSAQERRVETDQKGDNLSVPKQIYQHRHGKIQEDREK